MSVLKFERTQKKLGEFCGTWNYINPKVSAALEEEEDDVSNVKSTDRRHITYYRIYAVLVI